MVGLNNFTGVVEVDVAAVNTRWRPNGPLKENGELFANLIPSSSVVLSFVILLVQAPTPTATALQRGQKKTKPHRDQKATPKK